MPKRKPQKVVDARAVERTAVKSSLAAAEAAAASILRAKPSKVTSDHVVTALRAMEVMIILLLPSSSFFSSTCFLCFHLRVMWLSCYSS
jgi:hypothetical protein